MTVSRRAVLAGGAATAGALASGGCAPTTMPGTLGGADFMRGHRLRARALPAPTGPEERAGVVIAGGGVAGLAAGWRMAEAGFHDFVLLELEDRTGGNARSGESQVTRFPLGAHYLPIPNREARALIHMLTRFGMITGADPGGAPIYDEYQLCADLEERLFWRGSWQEGLFPKSGLSDDDLTQHRAFEAAMAAFSHAVGNDGRPAFAVPMALSSADPAFTALDATSFAAWLDAKGWRSAPLRAWVRYSMRDDYGTEPEHVSAWAGVHYFAGRRGWAAGGAGDSELVWPEGNDHLASLMAAACKGHIRTGHSVFRAVADSGEALVEAFDTAANRSRRIRAMAAILAMPQFVAARVTPGISAKSFSYAPWVVANVHVAALPSGPGAALAWDNVSAASGSLGYVVATHQTASGAEGPSVLTWYNALSAQEPAAVRKAMLTKPLSAWQAEVRDDMVAMHPELSDAITRIDVWRWGHAMVRPTPGFLTDPARLAAQNASPPLLHAHSDLSGLSLFEEAHYRGVLAAERAMAALGHRFESLL
jgi:hypothetical protein